MRKIKTLLLIILLVLGSAAAFAQQFQCPAGSTPVSGGGGMMCQCPDGSFAGMDGCRSVPQQPRCPAGTSYCGQVNLCCGSGSYCSKYGCTPNGAIDCGNHYCNPGLQCTSGGCMPAGHTECGNNACPSGTYCGSKNQCMADGATDCGNGSSCADGKKCSRDSKHCLAKDTIDCGSHFCNAGSKCGSGNSCLGLTAVDCGGGKSCQAGFLCRTGGGCVTRETLAAEKAAAEKIIADKKAADKAAADRIAADKAAAVKARADKIAADKAAAAKAKADKIAADKAAAEKAAAEKVAARQAVVAKLAAEKAAAAEKIQARRKDIGAVRPTGVRQSLAAWSVQRMRAVKPYPLPELNRDPFKDRPVIPPATPASPQGDNPEFARGPSGSGASYAVPLKWAGKIFFTTPAGDSVCSGQFIAPNIVLTAAHCVRDHASGKFHDNLAFALQYQGGTYSGKYGSACVATPDGWVQPDETRYRWDYALILTDRASPTGHFGWKSDWNGSYDMAHKIGYPVDIAAGQIVQVDQGPLTVRGSIVEMRHGNPLNKGGSSGGAWVGRYGASNGTNENFALSVSSFIVTGAPEVAYGPYLDHDFVRLLEFVKRGC